MSEKITRLRPVFTRKADDWAVRQSGDKMTEERAQIGR